MRIALDSRFREIAAERLQGHDLVFYESGVPSGSFATREEFLRQVGDAHVLACGGGGPWRFDEEIIAALPNLRFIHKIGTGTNWFDIGALTRRGILLATNAGLNAASVADHIVMLLLMCVRSAIQPMLGIRAGRWDFVLPQDIAEVEDVVVGIVGFGHIGAQVAQRLLGFGSVRILVHQRRPIDRAANPHVHQVPRDDLLRQSEVVVLCVPLTSETDGMIGERELAMMRPRSVLINASRGRVVDERALYTALTSGHLRTAASDVFAEEPVSPDNSLLTLPNFIGTPHMAGRSRRNSPRQLELTLENINRFLNGQRPERLINPEALTYERTIIHRTFVRNGEGR